MGVLEASPIKSNIMDKIDNVWIDMEILKHFLSSIPTTVDYSLPEGKYNQIVKRFKNWYDE